VTLTDEAPLATMGLGMDVGQWDGTNCTTVISNTNSKVGTALIGTNTSASNINLCVRVYDVGNITEGSTVTYTVTAQHVALSS
jgi:hypothetical protein